MEQGGTVLPPTGESDGGRGLIGKATSVETEGEMGWARSDSRGPEAPAGKQHTPLGQQ